MDAAWLCRTQSKSLQSLGPVREGCTLAGESRAGRWLRGPNPGAGALPPKVGVSRARSCGRGLFECWRASPSGGVVGERCPNLGTDMLSRSG